jgi:hypothetical protein
VVLPLHQIKKKRWNIGFFLIVSKSVGVFSRR